MDKVINIEVRNRIAISDPSQCIICGNEDYTVVFDFDEEWSGIDAKTARFHHKNGYSDVVFTGDTVAIPEMVNVPNVEIGVFTGDMTTTPATVRCCRSILCKGGSVIEPDSDVYRQIIDLINQLQTDGVTDEQIAEAVQKYLEENPIEGGGEAGEDGGYYTPEVDTDGNLIWTASEADMPSPAIVNIKGKDGEDGGYYTPHVDYAGNLTWIPTKDSMPYFTGVNIKGQPGDKGTSVTIMTIKQSTADGGSNVVTFSDGNTLTVKNGSKGSDYVLTDADKQEIAGMVDSSALPDYVEAEISITAASLYAKSTLGNVGIVGFSTDHHVSKWEDMQESTNTPGTIFGLKALRKITDMFPFNAVVFGGDYANGSASSINEGVYMVYAPLTGAACPVMGTAGNHDSWQDQQDVTNAQIFKRHAARAKVDYPAFAPLDKISANGYYDDPTVNIRYIILDAEPRNTSASINSTATITANLTTMLDGIPEGYKAIIFSHKPLNSALGNGFKDAVNNATVLEANAEKIICCINGHGHTDASETLNGVLYIQTRAAAPTNYMGVVDLSTAGTADETAFDVFVIDQENGKIYAVRYGAGADREFHIPVPNTEPINEIPISTDTDGSIYNGIGYKTGCRINSSGVLKENENSYALTGFIPYKAGDIAYISPDVFEGNPGSCSISGFKSDKSFATNASIYANNSYGALVTESDGNYSFDVNLLTTGRAHWNNVEFIRVSGAASTMSAASVITVKRVD